MLAGTEEEIKKVTKIRKHRPISRRGSDEIPRKTHRSPRRKRTNSPKLTKDEVKYQRFVKNLKKDIQIHLNQCLRESRFDLSSNQDLRINNIDSTFAHHRQRSMKSLKNNEKKRLTADVQTILTGPTFKNFYTQFIQSREHKSTPVTRLRPLEESTVWPDEQE